MGVAKRMRGDGDGDEGKDGGVPSLFPQGLMWDDWIVEV